MRTVLVGILLVVVSAAPAVGAPAKCGAQRDAVHQAFDAVQADHAQLGVDADAIRRGNLRLMGYQHAMDWVSTLAGIAEVRLGNAQRFLAAHCKHGGNMEACANKPFWVRVLQARIAADSVKFETLHGLWSAEWVNLQALQADRDEARSELATDQQRLVDAKAALAVCEG